MPDQALTYHGKTIIIFLNECATTYMHAITKLNIITHALVLLHNEFDKVFDVAFHVDIRKNRTLMLNYIIFLLAPSIFWI